MFRLFFDFHALATIAGVYTISSAITARRASTIDPVTALRVD